MENPDKVHNHEIYMLQKFLGTYMVPFAGATQLKNNGTGLVEYQE